MISNMTCFLEFGKFTFESQVPEVPQELWLSSKTKAKPKTFLNCDVQTQNIFFALYIHLEAIYNSNMVLGRCVREMERETTLYQFDVKWVNRAQGCPLKK